MIDAGLSVTKVAKKLSVAKDTVKAAETAAKSSVALEALEIRQISLTEAAVLTEFEQDGAEAVEFIFGEGAFQGRKLEDGPKVILLDLKLPKIDGMEVLRRVKADPRTRSIPVVVLTSSKEQKDVVESYQLGVNSYIVKPVEFDQFFEVISNLGFYWAVMNKVAPSN